MFFILIISTAFFAILFQYSVDKNLSHPLTAFNVTWLLAVLFSKINISNLYVIDDNTYLYIWVGQITFNFIIGIYTKGKFINFKLERTNNFQINNLYSKIIYLNIVQLMLFVCMIPVMLQSLNFISAYGVHATRTLYALGADSGFMTTFQRLFYIHLGIFPLVEAIAYIQLLLWVMGKIKFKYAVIGIINIVAISFISVGRLKFIYFAIALLVAYALNKEYSRKAPKVATVQTRKSLKNTKNIILFIVLMVIITTIFRHNINTSILYSIMEVGISYLTDGVVIFNYLLSDMNDNTSHLIYGEASLAGLLGVGSHFLQFLSLGKIVIPVEGVLTEVSTFYEVGTNKMLNGYPTMYYYFYRDFGILGIIIFTAFLALISIKLYKRVKRNPSFVNQILYVNLMLILLFGILRWELSKQEVVMRIVYTIFIIVFIFYKPIRLKKRILKNEK